MQVAQPWYGKAGVLPSFLPEKLNPNLLPQSLAPFLKDVSERMGVPLDALVPTLFVGLSKAVGNKVSISPLKHDSSFDVIPVLWGANVSPPSTLKSPIAKKILFPLEEREKNLREIFKAQMDNWRPIEIRYKTEIDALTEKLKKHFKTPSDETNPDDIQDQIKELQIKLDIERPSNLRVTVNDTTIEALQSLLVDNPMGLLYYLDELARLLHLFNKAGRETDRTFLLECWSGNGIYTVDRIGRGSFTIENLSVYLLGNIQPDVLKKFILESNTKVGVDGFYNRIQIMVAPNPLDYSVGTDRREDLLAIEEYKNIFNKLFLLQELSEKKTFSFDVKAQAIYDEWRKQHQELMQSKSLLMQAHLGKYRSLIPALALIYHLTENISADTPQILVGESSINKAIQLAAYLQSHADYIMERLHSGVLIAAHELKEKIIWGNLRDGMTLRELKRKQWSKLPDDTVIREGLQILAEANWIRLNQKSVTGGQESISIELNPDNDEMQII